MNIYRASPQEQVERASREAAEWLHVMQGESGAAEREAFADWIASSPLHVRELLLASMLDRELSRPGVLDGFDIDAVIARATAGDKVVSLHDRAPRERRPGRHRVQPRSVVRWARVASIAAVALLGVASWFGMRQYAGSGVDYATAIGEQRSITLADGTIAALAPDSRISVDFSWGVRSVRLRQGQAQFDVTHDAARPFRVYAGANLIQDVGTVFSVNRLPSGTIVAVTQGSVQITASHLAALDGGVGGWVASWLPGKDTAIERPGARILALNHGLNLTAGEAVHLSRSGKALTRGTADEEGVAQVNARRLTFHNDTLADIAAEFNRYNARQIVIDGDEVGLQRYSGVFDVDDAHSFLQFLDCCSTLAVASDGNRTLIQARSATPTRQ